MATDFVPLILTNAGLKISGTELACAVNHIEISPDVNITTLDTMCGSRDYPGTVKWSLIATLYQSFDASGPEAILSAAVAGGVAVPFVVTPYRDKAVSATNPQWSGTVIPRPYAPINGDAGNASEIALEWSIVGAPQKGTGITATGATAGTPGTFTPAGASPPANLAAMTGITASPATAWTTGQYVVLGDASNAHWSSSAWVVGIA